MSKRTHVEIKLDPEGSWIEGRNGIFDITAISVWSHGAQVFIEGIGKRGRAIRGGLGVDSEEAMDRLAIEWLNQRSAAIRSSDRRDFQEVFDSLAIEWLSQRGVLPPLLGLFSGLLAQALRQYVGAEEDTNLVDYVANALAEHS